MSDTESLLLSPRTTYTVEAKYKVEHARLKKMRGLFRNRNDVDESIYHAIVKQFIVEAARRWYAACGKHYDSTPFL